MHFPPIILRSVYFIKVYIDSVINIVIMIRGLFDYSSKIVLKKGTEINGLYQRDFFGKKIIQNDEENYYRNMDVQN